MTSFSFLISVAKAISCLRFLDKMQLMDCSFCTTSPDILKFPKKNRIYYIPNPADESFENLEVYKKKNFNNDIFFAMSHGVHRGTLKKGKFGPLKMKIANKSGKYLDRCYKDWRTIAYIYNHHTKDKIKVSFKDYPELKKAKLPN